MNTYKVQFFSKLILEKDRLIIRNLLASNEIPYKQIASINRDFVYGINIETTGGKKYRAILWNRFIEGRVVEEITKKM